jgi:Flp pilus assembly protein CpaB
MKARIAAVLLFTIASGLVVYVVLASRHLFVSQNPPESQVVTVLVAKWRISKWVRFTVPEHCFKEKLFIKGQEPAGAITQFQELKNRRLNKDIDAGVHVTQDDLYPPGEQPWPLREGMRVVEIPFDSSSGLAFFGSRMDVITVTPNGEQSKALLLAEDVLIVDSDGSDDEGPPDRREKYLGTARLQATKEVADILEMAANCYRLRLIYHRLDD